MFTRLALIGCGLMGGSFALAARQAGLVRSVCGYSRSAHSALKAQALGILDEVAASPAECVRGGDLVLLAVPVASTEANLRALLPGLAPSALVMDVGSTKQDVVQAARAALGERLAQFMPAHPICGKEVAGIEHADAGLYQGQQLILTPLECHSAQQIERARQVWAALGCRVHSLDPDLHDQALAAVSHFPHMLAFALMHSLMSQPAGEQYLALGGPGFRDSTRIAAGDPDLWSDVLLANRAEVLAQSRALRQALSELEQRLAQGERQALRDFIASASQRRADWRMAAPQAPSSSS